MKATSARHRKPEESNNERQSRLPRRQQAIATAHSGYATKVVAYEPGEKPYARWDYHRVDAMRVALAFKLFQNPWFGDALLATGRRAIVGSSDRDAFWGARPTRDGYAGANVLGKLLAELREHLRSNGSAAAAFAGNAFRRDFRVNGKPVTPEMLAGGQAGN